MVVHLYQLIFCLVRIFLQIFLNQEPNSDTYKQMRRLRLIISSVTRMQKAQLFSNDTLYVCITTMWIKTFHHMSCFHVPYSTTKWTNHFTVSKDHLIYFWSPSNPDILHKYTKNVPVNIPLVGIYVQYFNSAVSFLQIPLNWI